MQHKYFRYILSCVVGTPQSIPLNCSFQAFFFLTTVGQCNLRLNGHRHVSLGASRRVLESSLLGMDVAVELVVEVVVALVLQRGAAGGALEALHVQVLVLDAHKDAAT